AKDGDGIRRWRLEKARRDDAQLHERRPAYDGIEGCLTHPVHHLFERNRVEHLDPESVHPALVSEVRAFHLHGTGPGWKVGPPVAHDADSPDRIAYGFDRVEHTTHRPPSKLAVADIEHRKLLVAEIERLVPLGIVGIEQETADVVPKRVQRRLADLV